VTAWERGHVLARGAPAPRGVDSTDEARTPIRLPDERHGLLFVFRVFERVSYALILRCRILWPPATCSPA
jgi:hypothetical protein